jgi:hypothetical protein
MKNEKIIGNASKVLKFKITKVIMTKSGTLFVANISIQNEI